MADINIVKGHDIQISGQPDDVVNKSELLETEVTGGGGTRMGCVKEYIEDNNINNPTISVHLTDGYVEDYPEVTMGQHLFVISKGGSHDRLEHLGRITSMV